MKVRNGFVSNSSSSSFVITNKSNVDLTIVDFVKENPQLIKNFVEEYSWYNDENHTQEKLIESAEQENTKIPANTVDEYIFGDESYTLIGKVFDYILRDGGESENFTWKYYKSYR